MICCMAFIYNVYYYVVIRNIEMISRNMRVKHISRTSTHIFIFALIVKNINIEFM